MKVLAVKPSPHRVKLNLPEELQVGWLIGGNFWKFASCKNRVALESLIADAHKRYGEFEIMELTE